MRLAMAALVAGTGCAQLFGLDETTGADANLDVASAQVQRVSIGASVRKAPQDLSGQTATFLQDDGAGGFTQLPGELAGMDTFTAAVPGTPPAMFTVPDELTPRRLWALPARAQRGNLIVFEHPGVQPPLPSSQIVLSVTLPSPYVTGQSFLVQSIGAWMQRPLMAAEAGTPDIGQAAISSTLDYSTFTTMNNAAEARITSADVTLLLRYSGQPLTGVFQAQFEQTDGADGMTGTMTAVTADKPIDAMFDPTSFSTRFAAVRPGVTGLAMAWRVSAAPGWSVGSEAGVRLHAGTLATDAMTLPAGTMFGNPFESLDWRSVFAFGTTSSRPYTYTENAMSAAISLSATMATVAEPGATPVSVTMPAGLPITIRANMTALTTDGMPLALDLTKPVEVSAIIDETTNTMYQLSLVELGLDITGTAPVVTRRTVLDAVTVAPGEPTFRIPQELFTVGKSYYITVRCYQGGFTGAADGDLTTTTLPYSTGALDSAVFTVEAP